MLRSVDQADQCCPEHTSTHQTSAIEIQEFRSGVRDIAKVVPCQDGSPAGSRFTPPSPYITETQRLYGDLAV
ncbi:hypothetical protein AAFF_G00044920 [Aldrovandia affinis]|uniref:Uncharacterized protein n=1 Tax=Aldrovandia affinis TaxID=143900 RepID=A0AAD7WEW3_9TELE|nr:hypothetical protein AAFF_G00044920 [Aldrovandia affinis]